MVFRILKPRFQRIMEDIGATGNSFYLHTVDAAGNLVVLVPSWAFFCLSSALHTVFHLIVFVIISQCPVHWPEYVVSSFMLLCKCPDSQVLKQKLTNCTGMFIMLMDCLVPLIAFMRDRSVSHTGVIRVKFKADALQITAELLVP
jgi:uncharacterized membrane protein